MSDPETVDDALDGILAELGDGSGSFDDHAFGCDPSEPCVCTSRILLVPPARMVDVLWWLLTLDRSVRALR